ncbi:hypothetical protein U9M48_032499 [Paspalum notatum var. saurae]|uniref:Uncharacterized protein n=1 Tax=Paspalum notatum var. saurae TaxID=547442 RepID=A0AAQ3U5F4_PASNO
MDLAKGPPDLASDEALVKQGPAARAQPAARERRRDGPAAAVLAPCAGFPATGSGGGEVVEGAGGGG